VGTARPHKPMKLAIIGGGGVRVPLLVHGLVRRGLPFTEVHLFDADPSRLAVIARLTSARAPQVRVRASGDLATCVADAEFIVTSIRVGGLAAREHDERVALRHGLVGQETVGPAGFAMAVRTLPVLAEYCRAIAEHAPEAWVINFTNPVGIVTQGMRRTGDLKVIGICDTPTELFAEIAHALDLPLDACRFDYIGLNHLGWVREVFHRGQPVLPAIWSDERLLARVYSRPLFPPRYLADRRLLPTEYVYFYEFPQRAVSNTLAAGSSRGAAVRALTEALFSALQTADDPISAYEAYLQTRSASYMQIESGGAAPQPVSPWAELTGYDRIAFDVMHAIVHNTRAIIPLNVPNSGNVPELAPDDIVEVPCVVTGNGATPLHVGAFPSQAAELAARVKRYERKTLDAAFAMSRDALVDALSANPLVPSTDVASRLVDELILTHAPGA
jgi:6-phospho-beta-glucosidase